MNEIIKIHLGRQPYTIAVDAHEALQDYLAAIKKQVGDQGKNVLEEVEMRMAELLAEHGITTDKVVLTQDIVFLKRQLGEPSDFKEDAESDDSIAESIELAGPKRLFRDTEHGILAGVIAGLSAYSGIPLLLLRLIFVALAFFGGVGIVTYILLWLLVPPAESSSDLLQMKGQPVTIDNIKGVINRADVPGAAQRAGKAVGYTGDRVVRLLVTILGIGFIVVGIGLLAAAATAGTYALVHGAKVGGMAIFPVGTQEASVVICIFIALVLMAIMLAIIGRSILVRQWTFPSWALAAIIGGFVVTSSVGVALGLAAAPAVEQRYNRLHHSQVRNVPRFSAVDIRGDTALVTFEPATRHSIELRSIGNVQTKDIITTVTDDTLLIDVSRFKPGATCSIPCPLGPDNVHIIVYGPTYLHDFIRMESADE